MWLPYTYIHIYICLIIIAINNTLEEIETGRLYGSSHHIAKMRKQILVTVHQACDETFPPKRQIPWDFQLKHFEAKLPVLETSSVKIILKC